MSSRPGTAQGSSHGEFTRKDLLGSSSSNSTSHKTPITALAWSNSGKKLVSASQDGAVKVWNAEASSSSRSDKAEHEFTHNSKECVTALAFNPKKDDTLAVIGSHVTKIYDLRAKSSSAVLVELPVPDAISAAWDNHDNLLVSQLNNAFSHVDMKKKRVQRKLTLREGDEVTNLAFIDKGKKVLVATRHGVEVRSWPSFELLTVLQGHARHHGREGGVTAIAVTREEECKQSGKSMTRLLATGGMDAMVAIWDLQAAVPQSVVYQPDEVVRALSFSADQQLLAYCQGDIPQQPSRIDIVAVTTGKEMYRIPLQKATEVLAFNPRWPKLLAFAEPVMSYAKDSRGKDTLAGVVSTVQLK